MQGRALRAKLYESIATNTDDVYGIVTTFPNKTGHCIVEWLNSYGKRFAILASFLDCRYLKISKKEFDQISL